MTDQAPATPDPTQGPQAISPEQRQSLLAQAVAREVASGGRVESQSPSQAIIVKGKPVSHTLHLILTLVTLSLWSWVPSHGLWRGCSCPQPGSR